MSKYDLGYKTAQKGLVGILCRPNSDSWELEKEFSDEVKSGQKKKTSSRRKTVLMDGYNNSTLRVDE